MTRPPDADPRGSAPLSPERWARVRALVEEALTHSADERSAWLAASCGSDEALRRSVENLAASFERGESWEFLARPAGEFAGPLVAADPGRFSAVGGVVGVGCGAGGLVGGVVGVVEAPSNFGGAIFSTTRT